MQNKKSVVFVEPENMFSLARSIKKELAKDAQFAGIVIAEKSLRCLVKNFVFDKLFPEHGTARTLYKKLRKKRFKRKPEMFTYGDSCGIPQKTMRNLLYRFVPDIVVVSTEEALRSVVVERKKLGIKCDLGVLCPENFGPDIVDGAADFYFVESIAEKRRLTGMGIAGEKVILGITAVMGEVIEEEKRTQAKENLGLGDKKVVLYLAEECSGAIKEKMAVALTTQKDVQHIFLCGTDGQTAEYISSYGGRVLSEQNTEEAITAADVVFYSQKNLVYAIAEKASRPLYSLESEETVAEMLQTEWDKNKDVVPPPPYECYASHLKTLLEQKKSVLPIESDEEESWELEEEDDD